MIAQITDLGRKRESRAKMSRLTDKLRQAAGVTKRVTAKVEARADALIAREGEMSEKIEDAFVPHEKVMDEQEQGLNEVENALGQMSNEPPKPNA